MSVQNTKWNKQNVLKKCAKKLKAKSMKSFYQEQIPWHLPIKELLYNCAEGAPRMIFYH